MKRHCITVAASLCAFALVPSAALADSPDGGLTGGLVKQVQTATNQNETTQTAESNATNEQTNVNAPVSILSSGSNDGDVHQSNNANTSASSKNSNETNQGNDQSQNGRSVPGDGGPAHHGQGDSHHGQGRSECAGKGDGRQDKDRKGKDRKGRGGKADAGRKVDQSQSGSNANGTTQKAESKASNTQSNKNAPVSVLSSGSNDGRSCGREDHGGGVQQSNSANTSGASSVNSNKTGQGNEQNQQGSAAA